MFRTVAVPPDQSKFKPTSSRSWRRLFWPPDVFIFLLLEPAPSNEDTASISPDTVPFPQDFVALSSMAVNRLSELGRFFVWHVDRVAILLPPGSIILLLV